MTENNDDLCSYYSKEAARAYLRAIDALSLGHLWVAVMAQDDAAEYADSAMIYRSLASGAPIDRNA